MLALAFPAIDYSIGERTRKDHGADATLGTRYSYFWHSDLTRRMVS
jgi:hypothetical protein